LEDVDCFLIPLKNPRNWSLERRMAQAPDKLISNTISHPEDIDS
jgi:hypothetical protein